MPNQIFNYPSLAIKHFFSTIILFFNLTTKNLTKNFYQFKQTYFALLI